MCMLWVSTWATTRSGPASTTPREMTQLKVRKIYRLTVERSGGSALSITVHVADHPPLSWICPAPSSPSSRFSIVGSCPTPSWPQSTQLTPPPLFERGTAGSPEDGDSAGSSQRKSLGLDTGACSLETGAATGVGQAAGGRSPALCSDTCGPGRRWWRQRGPRLSNEAPGPG